MPDVLLPTPSPGGVSVTSLLPTIAGVEDPWRVGPEEWPQAVAAAEGPQLVVAGPGTGKTEFLVQRTVHVIESGLASPEQIMLLTFSRRAAADLRRRVSESLSRSTTSLPASTFHSFAYRLLEAHRDNGSMPVLMTGPEQVALVGELLAGDDPERWAPGLRSILSSSTLANEVADFFMRCAERLLGPEALEELAGARPEWRALPELMRRYEEQLLARRRIDYGRLLSTAVELLSQPEPQTAVSEQFRFVLVDEYQDTSPAQARLLELVSTAHRNLTVAADPYQSIYSFRGAELDNVAGFSHRFPDIDGRPARRVVLTTSFRVPAEILEAALRTTEGGELPGETGRVLPARHPGKVDAFLFDQQSAEAEWIASEVERLHHQDEIPYHRIAVLVRSKRHLLPELSRSLERRQIPHDPPDTRLVDHPAVRMIHDLVQAAVFEDLGGAQQVPPGVTEDNDRAVRRVLLGPLFALPLGIERDLLRLRHRSGRPWSQLLADHLPGAEALSGFLSDPAWAVSIPATEGFWKLWTDLPQFEPMVHSRQRDDFRAAWSSFAQALSHQFDRDPSVTLATYLDLTAEEDFEANPLIAFRRQEDRLVLTTLHQAKGLEFEAVFIADATEGVFPDLRRTRALLRPDLLVPGRTNDAAAQHRFRLQEEMRLAYTAMTRARSRLVWTATKAGIDEGEARPSRFLLAASGLASFDHLGPPSPHDGPPLSRAEALAQLRRDLADPFTPAARRLAAARLLADPPDRSWWTADRFAGVRRPGPDTGVIQLPLRLSPTQANLYQNCPRRYAIERRLRAVEASSPYLQLGSLVHDTLERAEQEAMAEGKSHASGEDALAVLDQVWSEADFGTPVLTAAWRARAVRLLERLYQQWPSRGRPVALEYPLELEIDGVTWQGRADRIERTDDGFLVIDYKTGSTAVSKDEAAESLQLGFYVEAAKQDPGLGIGDDKIGAELWYPGVGPRKTTVRIFQTFKLPEVVERLSHIAGSIAAEDWTPVIGPGCERCPVRPLCPAWPEGREAFVA
jgi:superfamily I DNA/RNA helicase